MPKDRALQRQQMRERIAHLAARLIAVDGIRDYALAKRKAAQQMGAEDTQNLPNNSEIDEALRLFRELFQKEEHEAVLRHLREQALAVMRLLERFNPYLTGSVLAGTAGKYSDINLHLYTDSVKDVELFLINREIVYKGGEKRIETADGWRVVPTFTLEAEGSAVNIAVFSRNDQRIAVKPPPGSAYPGRAKAEWVENLLKEDEEPALSPPKG